MPRRCFINEIAAWETLRHPNIVEVTAVNILPVPYVEMAFVPCRWRTHNILMTDDIVPKITDLGMSKVLAAEGRRSSVAGFSLSYAAPEQVSLSEFGRTDERTDLYQLGGVFYELVTGSIPLGGGSIV